MTPLRVTAHLGSHITLRSGMLGLDSLLIKAACRRDGLPNHETAREMNGGDLPDVPIPIALEPCGRFYLASIAVAAWDVKEMRFKNKRSPKQFVSNLTRVKTIAGTGAGKDLRIPYETGWVRGDRLEWSCMGDADAIRALLATVTHVGAHRGAGSGKVLRWLVEPCDAWEGFPVLRDGVPMRPLPYDYDGLSGAVVGYAVLKPPYQEAWREELCAIPV
jgi:hypothetical protein